MIYGGLENVTLKYVSSVQVIVGANAGTEIFSVLVDQDYNKYIIGEKKIIGGIKQFGCYNFEKVSYFDISFNKKLQEYHFYQWMSAFGRSKASQLHKKNILSKGYRLINGFDKMTDIGEGTEEPQIGGIVDKMFKWHLSGIIHHSNNCYIDINKSLLKKIKKKGIQTNELVDLVSKDITKFLEAIFTPQVMLYYSFGNNIYLKYDKLYNSIELNSIDFKHINDKVSDIATYEL